MKSVVFLDEACGHNTVSVAIGKIAKRPPPSYPLVDKLIDTGGKEVHLFG